MSIVILRSEDRNSGSVSNGKIILSKPQTLNGKFKVINFIMPNGLLNVNSTNNKIYFDEGATLKTATLTSGYYNSTDLALEIQTQMNISGAGTFTCVYNSLLNKFNWTSTANFAFSFVNTNTNSAYKLLGMNQADVSPEATTEISDNSIDLGTNKIIYMNIPEASNNIQISNNKQSSIFISVESNYGEILRKNLNDYEIYLNFVNKKEIHYTLHSADGIELVNLNGTEWILTLRKI